MAAGFGTKHVPILLKEILEKLAPASGRFFIDGTLGGGGHTRAFLEAGAEVWGFDADENVIRRAGVWGADYGKKFKAVYANFAQISEVLEGREADGILLDLGISSDQLDDPTRGLTYKADGPLDMRLDLQGKLTAERILNEWPEKEIGRILKEYGDEPKARQLATAIVKARPLASTLDFLKVIEEVYPPRFGLKRSHPAARIFQALRVCVNDEMGVLEGALRGILGGRKGVDGPSLGVDGVLSVGGRLAVITFQPAEERLVKEIFREVSQPTLDDVGRQVLGPKYKMLPKIQPGKMELEENSRAHSAQLRVIERLR